MSVAPAVAPPRSREEAVARARALFPLLRGLARRADDERHVPAEAVAAFNETGLVRILLPKRWGGAELGLTTHMEVAIELGRACGSVAWVCSFFIDHPFFVAQFAEEAQRTVWGDDPDARIASSFVPAGRVRPAEGGWLLSGDWAWASGVAHANWILLGGLVPREDGGRPELRFFLVPTASLTIVDSWEAAALRGTGSDNVIAEDLFVPEHMTVVVETLRDGGTPGTGTNPGHLYRQPFTAWAGHAMVAPAIGIAYGMLESWQEHIGAKAHSYTEEQAAGMIPVQLALAEAAVRIDLAEMLLRRSLELVDAGGELTMLDRARNRRDITYAPRLLVQATNDLMQVAGASAIRDDSPLQRGWRDVRAIACHLICNFNAAGEHYGRMRLGLPLKPRDPFY